jgi:hypothetical protein
MPRILGEQSSFDPDIPTPVDGDKNYSVIVDDSFQKLTNRTRWLKDNQLVGPPGPQGEVGPPGPQGNAGFDNLNGLRNPGGPINIEAGNNITITDDGDHTITISSGGIQYVSPPPTPTSPGVQGQRAYSSNFVYECIATNTWVRYAAATSW